MIPSTARIHLATIIPYESGTGVTVLGTPMRSASDYAYIKDVIERVLESHRDTCRSLKLLPDGQIQLHLLRRCLSACKLQHLLRSTECAVLPELLSRADMIIRDTLHSIVGGHVSINQWQQARLGIREGGLGIQTPGDVVDPARLAAI